MERYDLLYRLYDDFDAETLRQYQNFVDVFPPVDSRVALEYWQSASEELARRKDVIASEFENGDLLAEVAAHAKRDVAFNALDLYNRYDRAVNVLVLDVDETLRSAGHTDNEVPRDTLHLLTELHEDGVPIVICTGQTLENVKGFLIQGLGSELVHSGSVSIVYESGTGVFTPKHGHRTKQLLYEDLDPVIQDLFAGIRGRILTDAPEAIARGCHLQGNEFNITLKPNHETGSVEAIEIVDEALRYVLDAVGTAAGNAAGVDDGPKWARAFFGRVDPEIRSVLDAHDELPDVQETPPAIQELFDRIELSYYEGDAAEIGSHELNKVVGVEAALDVLGVDDPFALVMGDSKSDLRVMRWVEANDIGISAAPEHASTDVLEHVLETDELVFDQGNSAEMLRIVYVLKRLGRL